MKTVLKLLSAMAAVFGAAFVIATYGDQIVAWCKKLLSACPIFKVEINVEGTPEAPEASQEETPAEPQEETPAESQEEAPEDVPEEIPSNEPVAEETDFEA